MFKCKATWPQVLKVMSLDESRDVFLAEFRLRGGKPDLFAKGRATREAACEALVKAEDSIEHRSGHISQSDRAAIAGLRRQLELELWP